MSLLVWLPLNGNFTQQGVSDINITNTGVTFNNSGKLGQCAYFDGSAHYLQFDKTVGDMYSGDFSYAVWLNPSDDTRSIIFSEYSSTGSSDIAFELTAARALRLYWAGSPDIYPTNCVLPKNTWSHVVITRKGNVAKFYINGELRYTYSGTLSNKTSTSKIRIGDDYRGGTSVSYMGYMNDARIYNHCLSIKEIKELSKGLIAHYPLNGNGRSGDNIVPGTSSNEVTYTYPSSSYSDKWAATTSIVPSASQYILSFYAKSTVDGDKVRAHWYSPNTTTRCETNQGTVTTASDGNIDFTLSTQWKKYWCIYTQSSTTAVKHLIFPRMWNGHGTGTVSVKCVKLEEGTKVTPWMPNSNDSNYSLMGYNLTTEFDISGNGYNGSKIGTLAYNYDTIRYTSSTSFNGTDNGVLIENLPLSNIINSDITYSFWVKPNGENGARSVYFGSYSSTSWSIEKTTGNLLRLYWNGSPDETCSGASITDGSWQHICVTKSGTNNVKAYINGVQKWSSSANHNALSFPTTYRIGRDTRSGDGTPYKGLMSDFRIYATALSADAVKELYQMGASMANNKALLCYEFNEI